MSEQTEVGRLVDSGLHIAARRYMGVPFKHRGRDANGIDCVGLAVLADRDCGREPIDLDAYPRHPRGGTLEAQLRLNCGAPVAVAPVRESDLCPGDLVAIRYAARGPVRHVGIVGDHAHGLSLIHTDSHIGRVVEQRIDATVLARIAAVYRRAV